MNSLIRNQDNQKQEDLTMIKDNHENEIAETNENTQPAPSLREALKNNPQTVRDILKSITITSIFDIFGKELQANPQTSLIDNDVINEFENALLKIQENIRNSVDPLVLCIIEELTTFENKYPEISEVTVIDISQAISITERLDESELKELYAELEALPEPEESTETNPALKYKKYLFQAIQRGKERYEPDKKGFEKMLPTLQSKLPEWHTMPIQKLASELQHGIINNGAFDIVVAGKGKKNEITSYVLATYEPSDTITMTGKPYTEFDRQVHDAVSSLWEYGHESHVVTPDMVARAMTNKTQTEKVSPQFKEAVTKSLEKMWAIRIELDASKEIKKRKVIQDGEPLKKYIYSGNLLALEKLEVEAGGKTVKAYHILREPVLLEYAKMTNQLATIDTKLLDIKEVDQKGNITAVSIKSNEARVAVNGYLLRRIAVMKNDRTQRKQKQSNIILFDTLFEETGIPQEKHPKRIKDYTFQVLDYFTATGYIKGYSKRKNGKSFDAVIIDL